ncbi:Peptidase family M23 [compost metagenome]
MKFRKLLLSLVLSAFCLTLNAQNTKELARKKEALQREIDLAQKNLKKAESGKKLTLGQINAVKAQIRLRQAKISTINSEMKNLDNQITESTGKVQQLKGRLADLKKEYAGMIRFAQRNQNAYDKMMFIFAAKDFNQAYKRIKYLQQFGQYRKKQADYILGTQKELNNKIVSLDKNLKTKSGLLKEVVTETGKLDKNRKEQTVVLNRLSKQEKQFKQDIQKKKQQQRAIDNQIKIAIQKQIAIERKKEEDRLKEQARIAKAENKPAPAVPVKAKTTSELLRATPEAAKLSEAFENNRGSLPAPVAFGTITAHFGAYMVDQASGRNEGITYQTNENAQVRAVFNGQVSTIFEKFGKWYVLIKHGEYFTVYQNLKSVSVREGAQVSTKQVIGLVGHTEGIPELGFGIIKGSVPQNPESWIAR